ncbi:MAG: hypothetical protein HY048_04725 [Acidobacteria bacterium]|nr:hypothetical protein [Acidobacteriota bacterium]
MFNQILDVAQRVAQVSARVKKMIDGAEKQTGEIKAVLVEKGYEELRGCAKSASSLTT